MLAKVKTSAVVGLDAQDWILNDESLGICKRCGAQKQFPVNVFGGRIVTF
jgi:hypothetical protein